MEHFPLSLDFIAGLVSVQGSFLITNKNSKQPTYVFQIKMETAQKDLLQSVALRLGLSETVHEYSFDNRSFVLLLVRSRESIIKSLIPSFDEALFGQQRTQYEEWRSLFYSDLLKSKYKKYLVQLM